MEMSNTAILVKIERNQISWDLIRETEDKVCVIRDFLKIALDRQKSCSNLKRKDIEFFCWRSSVLRFDRIGKPSLRFIGPYEIIERISPVAYRLPLPSKLEKIHNVFHVSMLRQYISDLSSRDVKELQNKQVP
ncbi:DNA/RNA polymerases superfamily protein [Gossypium australe]|uniref:DNA/RNA polymerases superfamily protein n=1 Tax=Gossypium australe TaxID=47621 RepID=A0A5B6X374_9ROSI|nr:DNA/RNA polymerases superfamily protein [Gossypium australe]